MRNALVATGVVVALVCAPGSAFAWGFAAHRLITRRALELLPAELKPFFDQYKDEIVAHSTDPDLWRNAGWDDDPNHFIDWGVPEYGKYPFDALPREYGAAVEKFGVATIRKYGTLPWREAEFAGNLRRTFEAYRRNEPYTTSDTMLFSAIAAHYIQDAYQPFHATDNYDGQRTGNNGIHSRFERDLVERFESRLTLTPEAPVAIRSPRDAAFAATMSGYLLLDAVLKADRDAVAGRDAYDDAYFEAFFTSVQPILSRRLSEAISATAGVILGAWEQAGRPVLRLRDVRPVEKVRSPR